MRTRTRTVLGLAIVTGYIIMHTAQHAAGAPEAVEQGASSPADCPLLACGLNGAWLGQNIQFYELDASRREFNRAHLRIHRVFKPVVGQPYGKELDLDVQGDQLIGRPRDGSPALTGAAVVDMQIEFDEVTVGKARITYTLKIDEVFCTRYWTEAQPPNSAAGPAACTGAPDEVRLYKIWYTSSDDMKEYSICGPNINTSRRGQPVSLEATAVIFRGDRYIARQDEKHGFIVQQTGPTDPWFNIACTKTTLSKLHLQRHTLAASDAQHQTTVAQRQTLLKLLAGDYCGSGKSFTHNGVPLRYKHTQQGWQPTVYPYQPANIASIDAIWKEDGSGARCIGKPRLSLYPNLEAEAFPGPSQGPLKQRIQKECQRVQHAIPDCAESSNMTLSSPDYAISGNPKPVTGVLRR